MALSILKSRSFCQTFQSPVWSRILSEEWKWTLDSVAPGFKSFRDRSDKDMEEFADWLEGNNFQPRMLEYLSPGIFTKGNIDDTKIAPAKLQVRHFC